MEEVLLIKVLWNKSLFYHLGRGGGKGEGKVIAFGLSQYIELINFLWSQLLTLSATTDPISVPFENQETPTPPPTRKTCLLLPPLFPSEKMVTYSLLLLSAFQRI